MGAIYNVVSQYIPFVRKKQTYTRQQALNARPVRNPVLKWEREEGGEARLLIPRRKDFVGRLLCRIFRADDHREIILDEVGSDIWELCDGDNTVQAIVAKAGKKYKMTRRECETSVSTYLKMLGDRNLVGFRLGGRQKK